MTRRVWLLHCLFFSFEAVEQKPSLRLEKGRFSDGLHGDVAEDGEDGGVSNNQPVVGFTVMPGFVVGSN
ncbi:hypothetical protein HPP92_000560 [Vanilla planifolia]|uniref:Uncharacterized protein n=1 Tax=Vanilla planifolia TaxID=51239 RepID=A0A835RUP0_VANPL|nr:hypothetical protein HPP92_000560 [Vanilla planifolia]